MDKRLSEIMDEVLADVRKTLEESKAQASKLRAQGAEYKALMKAIKGK